MAPIKPFSQKYRIAVSRVFGVLIVLLILFTGPSFQTGLYAGMALDLLCFVFVLAATFGRLWALAYISGHKTRDLITVGPYSMVRNPLYLFSFIGAVGIGLFTRNVMVMILILAMFGVYYPFVIRGEEEHLRDMHGSTLDEYLSRVPMFVPKFSLYKDEPSYPIDTRLFKRAFFSVVWFPLIYFLLDVVARLHEAGVIPVFFSIP
jgi:protein-S-isoprenylcysteine O-methyltransferase Ste14